LKSLSVITDPNKNMPSNSHSNQV